MPKPSLKTLLADLEADDLREVVVELCKLNPQNRTFVELFLGGSDVVDTQAVLDAFATRLRACFLARTGSPKKRPDLAEARRLVTEHERLAADFPALAAEASLVYVEAAADYADALRARYRYLQQSTLDAAVRMAERFVRAALERPSIADRLEERFVALARLDPRMGRLVAAYRDRDAARLNAPASDGDGYRVEYDRRAAPDDDAW